MAYSTQFTNGNTLAYCWGGMLEAIVRLKDLEDQSFRNGHAAHTQWLQRYDHIYRELPTLIKSFQSIHQIRANAVHSDVTAGPSFFVTHPTRRANVQRIVTTFIDSTEKRKTNTLTQLAARFNTGGQANDELVAAHPLATTAQLITIAGRTPTALPHIWANPVREATVIAAVLTAAVAANSQNWDEWVAQQPDATTAQLITIAGRTPTALPHIWANPVREATVTAAVLTAAVAANSQNWDEWVAQQPDATSAQLNTIAGRRPTAHANVLANPSTGAATLTWFRGQGAGNDIAVAAHRNTLAADLDAIARRTVAAHANVLANPHTDAATLTLFMTTYANTAFQNYYDTAVAAHRNTLAADLDTIARRVGGPAHTNVLRNPNTDANTLHWFIANFAATPYRSLYDTGVATHSTTLAGDLVTIAGRTLSTADLHNITIHANHNANTDTAVIRNNYTLGADLATIAGRTLLATDLAIIAAHPNANAAALTAVVANAAHNAASDTAVIGRNLTLAADLATIAARTLLATDLAIIAAHPNANAAALTAVVANAAHNANSDTAVIGRNLTLAADLATIAARTQSTADLHNITVHANHNDITDAAVVGNNRTLTADLLAIATRTTNPAILAAVAAHQNANAAVLTAVVANANHNAISDTAVVANNNTLGASLAIIAARTLNVVDLHDITAHANNNANSDAAVVGNNLTQTADLAIIRARTPALQGLINAHPNAPAAVHDDKRRRFV